jgi:hypothetical protein
MPLTHAHVVQSVSDGHWALSVQGMLPPAPPVLELAVELGS